MSSESPEQLIRRHEAFRQCRPVDRPLVGLWFGGYYPAEQFPRGTSAWRQGQALTPGDVSLEAFAADYESLYRRHREARDDFFFVGSAYWGIPWLEAMLGCPVSAASTHCSAQGCLQCLDAADSFAIDLDQNAWFLALVRFTRELVSLADGRFPVCPPLLRGPGDCACAMLGGMSFVTGLLEEPAKMKRLLGRCGQVRSEVAARLRDLIPDWHGIRAAGGYPSKVCSTGSVAYHQDDSAALLNPALFRDVLLPLQREMCRGAEVNFLHLHSACLYPVDILLEDGPFDILEINIDHAGSGPSVPRLLGTLKKIQSAGCPLVLWGQFSDEDWALIHRELSPVGLSLQPMITGEAGDEGLFSQ